MLQSSTVVAEASLRNGVDPDAAYYECGWTVLHMQYVVPNVVRLFLDWGADVDAIDVNGHTPLIWTGRATTAMLEGGAEPVYGVYTEREKRCEIDAFKARRDAVMRLLLSIPGLHRGLALRVGRWVLQTH